MPGKINATLTREFKPKKYPAGFYGTVITQARDFSDEERSSWQNVMPKVRFINTTFATERTDSNQTVFCVA
jgi:hypothetical protein